MLQALTFNPIIPSFINLDLFPLLTQDDGSVKVAIAPVAALGNTEAFCI